MANLRFGEWIEQNHSKFTSLTETVTLIMTRLLKDAQIPFLTITGRTKPVADCMSKARRKKYKNAMHQMTDISGVRIVVYFDYDIDRVNEIIEDNFAVDRNNSSNRDNLLLVNEVGYRSVHYVCDLGADRIRLRENKLLQGLKFELQVRTVLQHAWAELAHDRNYKFTGQLPKPIERKLFLLAGLMETADNGFSELSKAIDSYVETVSSSAAKGRLDIEINALSLDEFVSSWAEKAGVPLEEIRNRESYSDLVRELRQFGVHNLEELQRIIPSAYAENFGTEPSTVLGVVRDWMILSDPQRFLTNVNVEWLLARSDVDRYSRLLSANDLHAVESALGVGDDGTNGWNQIVGDDGD